MLKKALIWTLIVLVPVVLPACTALSPEDIARYTQIETQAKSNQERISELQRQAELSAEEQTELGRLVQENAALEAEQRGLLQKAAEGKVDWMEMIYWLGGTASTLFLGQNIFRNRKYRSGSPGGGILGGGPPQPPAGGTAAGSGVAVPI